MKNSHQLSVISYQLVSSSFSRVFLVSLLFLPLLFIQGCQSRAIDNGMQAQVVRVVSGQTLEAISRGEAFKVRLSGIEAPDLQQQPWGQAAKQQLEAMVNGKTVTLELDGQPDKFERQWAYVWQNGKLLNEQLLKEGYVLWDGRSRDRKYDDRLEKAQAWARIIGRGVWDVKQPMRQTPAEFRQMAGSGVGGKRAEEAEGEKNQPTTVNR
ncbi:thermonuclease family protein [Scytonema millei]|uniref:Thermonuclease family protein n=1 Tax=Scytonema millei VB511283 TaxID=1245923 RepID=A0A9X5I1N3_9CYAN|nr:thermonuclease family protein [Scytonema millei]NHC33403.1 thermonuclease family protein [Scytonema millei VB511283]